MSLSNLRPNKGSNKPKKRIGRGIGSKRGKTATKGHKGQKARKGANVAVGFEGGQTPLYRRVPKSGFKIKNSNNYCLVNLGDLNSKFKPGEVVNNESLYKNGFVKNPKSKIKILANGKLDKYLDINVDKITKGVQKSLDSFKGEKG